MGGGHLHLRPIELDGGPAPIASRGSTAARGAWGVTERLAAEKGPGPAVTPMRSLRR